MMMRESKKKAGKETRLLALVTLALQKLALLVLAHLLPAPLDHAAHGLLPVETGGMGTGSVLASQRKRALSPLG
jgi:hypothetical protein